MDVQACVSVCCAHVSEATLTHVIKGNEYTVKGVTLPSEEGSSLKRNNLLPLGEFFPF